MPAHRRPGPAVARRAVLPIFLLTLGLAVAAPPDLAPVLARLSAPQRELLQTRAGLWAHWSAEERQAFLSRAEQWDRLPAAERGRLRERYEAWRALPAIEQAQVQAAALRFAALPPAEQQSLRAVFDALDGSVRRGYLLGPALGADYPGLQPLLAQVPVEEHEPLLRVLRQLSAQQRQDLSTLVQRTPPHNRDALRRELLSTAESNLADWLLIRLER